MTFRRTGSLLTIIAAAAAALPAQSVSSLADRAAALHKAAPVIDGHNDYPWALREKSPGRDLNVLDIRQPQPSLMTDIARLRAGGVGGQFWSVYVPATMQGKEAVRATLEQIDVVHRMVAKYPDTLTLARTADDVEQAFKAGKIASMIGMEGGHSIDSSLAALRMMHALGAGYMTLAHSKNVPWADSATDKAILGGLSPFGEQVVREMNRLGMLVDLSHVSADSMADAIRVSRAPVIFSHSSARAVCAHPRNVPDEILKQLPANGGVVMVTFVPSFIAPAGGANYMEEYAVFSKLQEQYASEPEKLRAALAEYRKTHPAPKATLSMVADHIDHIRKVAGIDHIGVGGDFDGIDTVVEGLEDVSKYPALTAELLRRGYADQDIKKILSLNILRVMRKAESVAASLKGESPSVAVIK
jgi:membrane dipeptidase